MDEMNTNGNVDNKQLMSDLVNAFVESVEEFKKDSEKSMKGNKAAGIRARKLSLEIEKRMKEYRKLSLSL